MERIGEVWERNDGAIGVIVAASPRTKRDEVLLSALPNWIAYDDLPILGWTRLPWRLPLVSDPPSAPPS